MKKTFLFAATTLAALALTFNVSAGSSSGFYKQMIEKKHIGIVREYYSEDLTTNILVDRGDDIIIEKIIGRVKNSRKDGYILNADPDYNYISYKGVRGAKKGDTILTVCIYAPGNNYEDDICERFDYIIDREKTKK